MLGYVILCLCVADCSHLDRAERNERIAFVCDMFLSMGASYVDMSDEIVRLNGDDAYLARWYTFLINSHLN